MCKRTVAVERRASAGEAVFGVSGYEQLLGTQPAVDGLLPMNQCPPSSQTPLQGSPLTSVLTLEEEGERWVIIQQISTSEYSFCLTRTTDGVSENCADGGG